MGSLQDDYPRSWRRANSSNGLMAVSSPVSGHPSEPRWATGDPLRCSVIICAYTEDRWDDTLQAVESARNQVPPPCEVIVVVDTNPKLQERFSLHLHDVVVASNDNQQGLSGARNTGVALARGDVVAFLDDDAIAQPGWLAALMRPYADPYVLGVGGRTEPNWFTHRPRWFPMEFDWVLGCTYVGREPGVVRNLLGGNASFRRELFSTEGFATHIGRSSRHHRPLSGEESEFCIRASRSWPNCVFVYDDQAVIKHRVSEERQHFSYFRTRCFAEGMSKALVTKSVGFGSGLSAERRYTAVTLTAGLRRSIGRGLQGEWSEFLGGGAIVAGLVYTVCGYVRSLTLQILEEILRDDTKADSSRCLDGMKSR